MPARNAPSAIDTPNSCDDPTAMPSAITSTVSVKSSRDFVAAMRSSTRGITFAPTNAVKSTSAVIFSAVSPSAVHTD